MPRGSLAPLVTGLLLAVPQLAFPYPAMTDLPLHEGLVAILRHMDDPTFFPPGLYVTNFGHANQLFYLVAWALSYALGVPLACKVVVAATVFAIPVAGARFADHLGATRWATLLLAPVALGWLYYWGLIANLMGLAALLALLPTLDHLAQAPTARRALAASAACLLMYETHQLMLIAYAGAAVVFAAGYELRARPTALRLCPFATAIGLSVFEQIWGTLHQSAANLRVPTLWSPFWRKFYTIPGALFGGLEPPFLYTTTAVSVLAIALLVSARIAATSRPTSLERPTWRSFVRHFRFEVFSLSCFVLYLALPCNADAATLVYHRFLAPAYAVMVLCAGPRGRSGKVHRLTPLVTSAAVAAALLSALPILLDERAAIADVDHLFSRMAKGSAFAVVEVGPPPTERRTSAVTSVGDRALTFVGGRVLFGFAESAVAPVQYARQYEWDDPIRRTLFDGLAFRPAHDFTRFRYMLMRSTSALMITGVALAMAEDAHLVDTAGDWALFESKLPTVPLLSPDVPLPEPHPPTLRAMLRNFARSRDAPLAPGDIQGEPDPKQMDDGLPGAKP